MNRTEWLIVFVMGSFTLATGCQRSFYSTSPVGSGNRSTTTTSSSSPAATDDAAETQPDDSSHGGETVAAPGDSTGTDEAANSSDDRPTDSSAASSDASQPESNSGDSNAAEPAGDAANQEGGPSGERAGNPTSDAAGTGPSKPDGKLHRVTFDDIKLDMEADTVFETAMLTDRVKEVDGQRISIKGFMFEAGVFQQTGIRKFILAMNTQCKFGPGGQAFCVIPVELPEGKEADFTSRPITVEGLFRVEPFEGPDGNTWAVYRIDGERVIP